MFDILGSNAAQTHGHITELKSYDDISACLEHLKLGWNPLTDFWASLRDKNGEIPTDDLHSFDMLTRYAFLFIQPFVGWWQRATLRPPHT